MTSIKPHGGVLINRVANEAEREALLAEAAALQSIIVNTWAISDLDLDRRWRIFTTYRIYE